MSSEKFRTITDFCLSNPALYSFDLELYEYEIYNNLFKDYLNQSWELKKKNIKLNENFSNLLHLLEKNQISFKLCGAGGTGFLYTFLDDKNSEEINKLICSLEGGYKLLPMKIDTKGVMQIF